MGTSQCATRRIVVGVDGSPQSKAALAWAVSQAARTGAVIQTVTAYYWFPMPIEDIDYKGLATGVAEEAIRDVVSGAEPVKIFTRVVEGNAARALLEAAAGADLLVVGSRGRSGFTEALLGSVAQHCIHHATCPVVVIRGPEARRVLGRSDG
jgi:nucleotide-binding universal stress UspA family protein